MTESGEREIAESSAFVEYMRKRLGVHDLSSYLDSAAYESDRAMWQAAFEAGRGQEAELLDHALFCMDRGCKRCSEAIEQRRPAPPDSGDKKEAECG